MSKTVHRLFQLGVIAGLAALPSLSLFAGGPLQLFAPGEFLRWDPSQPVNFVIDNGPVRPGNRFFPAITREQGSEFVGGVIQRWADVATGRLTLEDRGFLPVDVTAANVDQFLNQVRPEGNPVIFDADGSIIEAVLGMGASNSTLGFAAAVACFSAFPPGGAFSSCRTHPGRDDAFYDYGRMVLNGRQASIDTSSPDGQEFARTVLHEFGHLLGLDHSQIGLPTDPSLSGFPLCGTQFVSVSTAPIMYPIVFAGNDELRRDDQVWLSFLYPTPEFSQNLGSINGQVFRRTGGFLPGANVVAVPVTVGGDGSIQESRTGQVSVVSEFLFTGDGAYQLPGLTDGDYVVFIERICPDFRGGSRVGPFEFRFTDFPVDYYNGPNESGDMDTDDPTERTVLSIRNGESVAGIDLVSNEVTNQLGSLGDDDEEVFIFPEGFVFPFYGRRYSDVVVNSDGSLTFGAGDGFTGARDAERLLTGPPRIAPLLSDLDPSEAGIIRAETGEDSVTFVWDAVPEFSTAGGRPPNTFSVTLFQSGDIEFEYTSIDIQPDLDSVLGVVGLSPGQAGAGLPLDLSGEADPIRFFDEALFESFPTQAAFDLVGSTLRFSPEGTNFFLYFPYFAGDEENFTGFALSNDEDSEILLQVEALDEAGLTQRLPINPNLSRLEGGNQVARLGADFFGLNTRVERGGWVRIGLSRPQVASFFQIGNGLRGAISRLDGSVAFTDTSNVLYFTRLYDGPGSFPALQGMQDAVTVLAVANPSEDTAIILTLRLFDAEGGQVAETVRELPALGCLQEGLSSLFGQELIDAGFVRVEVDGPGAVGFELVSLADTRLGFNASFGDAAESTSYSAQLANGAGGGLPIFTSVKLVNTANQPRQVTLTALGNDGGVLAVSQPLTLQPNESFQEDAGAFFGLGPSDGESTEGSLRVDADGPGVIGDVVFGDPRDVNFAAALPLQSRLLRRAIFSQVANARTGRASTSTFTGLAFHNPDAVRAAVVTVRVFNAEGGETGVTNLEIPPGGRLSRTLDQLIGSTAGQVGGYIVVESTIPVVAQQLFGNFALTFLSAVPPTVFE